MTPPIDEISILRGELELARNVIAMHYDQIQQLWALLGGEEGGGTVDGGEDIGTEQEQVHKMITQNTKGWGYIATHG